MYKMENKMDIDNYHNMYCDTYAVTQYKCNQYIYSSQYHNCIVIETQSVWLFHFCLVQHVIETDLKMLVLVTDYALFIVIDNKDNVIYKHFPYCRMIVNNALKL